VQTEI